MIDLNQMHDLKTFLNKNPSPAYVRLVLSGSVVSGQVDEVLNDSVRLGNVTISAGVQVEEAAYLVIPFNNITAWGKHPKPDLNTRK